MALEGRLRRHGAAVWLSLIKPMLVRVLKASPSTPTSVWDRSAPLQVSGTYSNYVRGRLSDEAGLDASRGCVRPRRPRRGQAGAQKPPTYIPWRWQSRVCAGGVVGRHPVRYRGLLFVYRLVALLASGGLVEDRPSPAGGAAQVRFRGGLRMRYAG
jgi:hypothetical protein